MDAKTLRLPIRDTLPQVLIVEDDLLLQETYADLLHNRIQLFQAYTIEEALGCFNQHQDSLAALVMDACVPGNIPNTPTLIQQLRARGFTAPILATSSNPAYVRELLAAGCSHHCEKKDVAKMLLQILR